MLTRLQARSVQSTDLVIPTRANSPSRFVNSRQDNAVVSENNDLGNRSDSDADGNLLTGSRFTVQKCSNTRCKTCPNLISNQLIKSNITGKTFTAINHSNNAINCHSQNLVYLISCNKCNLQYIGETTIPLHKRMNIHRTSKSGCQHFITHFNGSCKGYTFNIQVLEKLKGNGYTSLDEIDEEKRKDRLSCEDKWIKLLRTIFPYGLNDRVRNTGSKEQAVGHLFPRLLRNHQRSIRSGIRNHTRSTTSIESFFNDIYKTIKETPKLAFNFIRKSLDKCRKSLLKKIASSIMNNVHPSISDQNHSQAHFFILDVIETKIFKSSYKSSSKTPPENLCLVNFDNKAIEYIRLPSILKSQEVLELLPDVLKEPQNIPVVTYKLSQTIRNKIVNYKDVVNSLLFQQDSIEDILNMECDCHNSHFCDEDHGHVITGNLAIVNNSKLRKLLSKGPNYREKRTINFNKAKKDIIFALENLTETLKNKYKLDNACLNSWKDKVIQVLNRKIENLKKSIHISRVSPFLNDPQVIADLKLLQEKYVVVPVDKAANNFSFICKKYYILVLLKELDYPNGSSNTYTFNSFNKEPIISSNIDFCQHLGYKVKDEEKKLPMIYWIPKMHKTPVGKRFIIASKLCSTKQLSKDVSKVFKLLLRQIRNFHDKSVFYSNYNQYWVVENSTPVLEKIYRTNSKTNAKSISTFDFTTLYTKIPHQSLINVLFKIIDFCFSAGQKKFINVFGKSAYWSHNKENSFSKQSLKSAVRFLIAECHFTIGNIVFTQTIGIPMGIDPAPFWANLYLYNFEKDYIESLIHNDKRMAGKFHGMYRFIDDLCAINDGNQFDTSNKDIYPPELELKREHHGEHATFLDLDISIKDGQFSYKLYDKRDAFPFSIVRMPHLSSNIPEFVFYGTFKSEVLRIAKNTLQYEDFKPRVVSLLTRMINQGGCHQKLIRCISNVAQKHFSFFQSFSRSANYIARDVA